VHTRNALHQLPDFWKAVALDRIGRMLRPGGVLRLRDLVYDFQPSEADAVFQPALGYTRADLAEHIRSESSTFRWLLEPMLAAAGFEILAADFGRWAGFPIVERPIRGPVSLRRNRSSSSTRRGRRAELPPARPHPHLAIRACTSAIQRYYVLVVTNTE
jgi:hypothetical protein